MIHFFDGLGHQPTAFPGGKFHEETCVANIPIPHASSRKTPMIRRYSFKCVVAVMIGTTVCHADIVDDWCHSVLSAVRANRSTPTRSSRQYAMAQLAVFEAINGVQRTHRPYLYQPVAPAGASLDAAVSAAAYTVLMNLFTNVNIQTTNFTVLYDQKVDVIADGQAKADGIAYGQAVGNALIALRAGDGHDAQVPYVPGTLPGEWKTTPPGFVAGLDPQWPNMVPFCMPNIGEFRTHRAPQLSSSAYAFELNLVKAIGGADSPTRTADQTEIAKFWADGPGTETPPGHWIHNALIIANDRGITPGAKAHLLALVGIGLADACIVSWDNKYVYNYWRPVTAIREADTDGNPDTEADPSWISHIPTPPFPEYTSGHSTFSRTSATLIERFFGTEDLPFTAVSDDLPGVTRRFSGPGEAADESGISRIYGGIHFPSGNIAGQAGGYLLANMIANQFLLPLTAAQFGLVQRSGDNTELTIAVEPNSNYLIQASSDLKTWMTLTTVNVPGNTATFTDENTGDNRVRFYRAIAQ